jgi:hypothetical protein
MAITISGAGSSGNNDERTAEGQGRSGRVIRPLWNIVANAAIRTGTSEGGDLQDEQRQPPDVGATSRARAESNAARDRRRVPAGAASG